MRGLKVSSADWHAELKSAVRDPAQLLTALDLPDSLLPAARAAAKAFPLFAPGGYIGRMTPGRLDDPLLRQVLPLGEELDEVPGFAADAVGDAAATKSAGLIQKYQSRALLITTGACAVHCRYCFRRHFPYSTAPKSVDDWEPALDLIRADDSLDEVLLSGGDPLTLVDTTLAELAERLAAIPHLKRLRIHTRLPIIIPARVTSELLAWLCGTRLTPLVVIHANHAQEIDDNVANSLARLVDAGVPLLNQSVLLRGVNDSTTALVDLSRRLTDLRVMPYYLHQLDRVAGAAHFEVPISRGLQLIAEMRTQLPGYAVPRYVQEIAGEAHKRVLA
ncbi:L-lysine 2,3-aminomutase [Anatilimnocola aggregata]|uniref:L-lysine 2,3-aminomutase n=2 Tax=Anatilimnocola aggregata TaxID=2528021 RepID=A0A517YNX8_9BACT|nr:L-lysine 2,3-aminomutase [Anatilimnocola aggregata]